MKLRVAKKITKNLETLSYHKAQTAKAETVMRRAAKRAEKAKQAEAK
jgi:hypothetical protein